MTRGTIQAALRVAAVAGAGLVALAGTSDRALTLGPSATGSAAARVALTTNSLTCPGPELTGVPGVADIATRPLVVADSAPASVSQGERVRPAGPARLELGPVGESDESGAQSQAATGDIAWRVRGDRAIAVSAIGSRAPGLIAAQESALSDATTTREGIRGLVGAACSDPAPDSWLIAGGGDTGRQERLILVNPGANPAIVDVVVHGRAGPIEGPAGRGVSVPARSRVSVLLDGLAPDEPAPAVHVVSRSGLVAATLLDTWVDGVTPRGVDATGAAAPAALRTVIPAVSGPGEARVRIVATGGDDTIAQVRLLTRNGRMPLPGANAVARITGGATADVRLPKLPKDVVAVEVTSDRPAIAAAMTTRQTRAEITDLAWSPAAAPLRVPAGTTLPAGGGAAPRVERLLSLVATGGRAEADVTLVAADGALETQRIAVQADSSTTVRLGAAAAVWVRQVNGDGALRAGVVSTAALPAGAGRTVLALTTRPLVPARFAARELPVRQARP